MRWIHTHRSNPELKITQILGAQVAKTQALIPDCLGKFQDLSCPECQACQDKVLCGMKMRSAASAGTLTDLTTIKSSYKVADMTQDMIAGILSNKQGQIARTLSQGNKVVLFVKNNRVNVALATTTEPTTDKESTMAKATVAAGKGTKVAAKAAPVVEEEEEELEIEDEAEELEDELEGDEEEEDEDEDEDEDDAPAVVTPKKGAAKKAAAVVEAPAVVEKAKKAPKPAPVLNEAQQKFKDALDAKATPEEKQAYSLSVHTKAKLPKIEQPDPRVAHMQRVMAIKKHLGTK